MRLLFCSCAAALAFLAGCGPDARSTPTRSVDPSTLYVAQVHWSRSEIATHGVQPAFPRDAWVALVGEGGYARHGRVGGASRSECDECVGARSSVVLALDRPPGPVLAIGPSDHRLGPVALLASTPLEPTSVTDEWTATATFDLDRDGDADLERVERCGGRIPSGCDERVCARLCAATRTAGESAVRGEVCAPRVVVAAPCLPPAPVIVAPEPEVAPEPLPEPEVAPEPAPSTDPAEAERARRRRWGSRRRPR